MAAPKYETFDFATNKYKLVDAINSGGGTSGAGEKVISTDVNGRIDNSFMPTTVGQTSTSAACSEDIPDGCWTNLYWDATSSTRKVRKANAADPARICNSYVKAGGTNGTTLSVYAGGANDQVPLGSGGHATTASDVGKPMFLSDETAGLAKMSAPAASASGHFIQRVGYLIERGSLLTVSFAPSTEILIG